MENIINDNSTKSQPIEVTSSSPQINWNEEQLSNIIANILSARDKKDILIIEYILKANINEHRSVRVEELMEHLGLSNPAVSVRLKKMRETKIGGLDFPLFKTMKNGNALCYFFTQVIDWNKSAKIIDVIMSKRGITYEKYAEEKSLSVYEQYEDDEYTLVDENNEQYEDDEYTLVDENKTDNSAKTEIMGENLHHQSKNTEYSEEIDFDKLYSKTVTIGEVLEMLDETSNTLIENITEGLTEIFNEKIKLLNDRIVELEKKLSSFDSSVSNEESNEEILAKARMLVRQKIFAKKAK
ncbi:hypothetical protein [Anabaenopsis arnoldii]|uniref:Uncharacterized protein n=1 Tax=Anabaenopsis arnoldii TaxID=2152938 RepID=A0ABT5ALX2_9CYAN|nr:hypothetical protein [Anabaenopsis arnoldii]MDB9538298.1 hypothetical protein [Anabaenopsis arnoldii]MDH6090563.1 hypothetical protein [Anabaenopsis arnoldii]